MNDKYIIKNCPAFDSKYNECHSKIEPHKLYCMDCTDCVMKQIVQRCKDSMDYHSKNMHTLGRTNMAGIVLALLQIKEVE